MTQVWVYTIGAATTKGLDETLRQAGIPEFALTPWTPFHSDRELPRGGQILVLCAGDWRNFTKTDYFGAAHALALHESGALRLLPVVETGKDGTPQPDPWMERYRLMRNRLVELSDEKTAAVQRAAIVSARGPVSLFFSYCHRDEDLREQLERHLSLLERTGLIKGWNDRKIVPGQDWASEIDRHLYTADLILLLLSSDFFASDYCSEIETPVALARHKANSARAIPILLRPVVWRQSPLSSLGALPKDARPVTEWTSTDAAFVNVCEGILNSALAWSGAAETEPDALLPAAPRVLRTSTRKRHLDAAMPAAVQVDRSVMLAVLVRKSSSTGLRGVLAEDPTFGIDEKDVKSRPVVLGFPIIPESGKPGPLSIAITVTSPEFSPPSQTRQISIAPDYDSLPCIFLLAAKRSGELVVLVEAYHGEKCIVSCPIRTKAVAEEVRGAAVGNIASADFESSLPPDPRRSEEATQAFKLPAPRTPAPPAAQPQILPPPRAPRAPAPPASLPPMPPSPAAERGTRSPVTTVLFGICLALALFMLYEYWGAIKALFGSRIPGR
jgi:TIR domain